MWLRQSVVQLRFQTKKAQAPERLANGRHAGSVAILMERSPIRYSFICYTCMMRRLNTPEQLFYYTFERMRLLWGAAPPPANLEEVN